MGAVLLPLFGDAALADKRVALVVGNSAYQNVVRLPNPVNDASAIAELFRGAGFDAVDARSDLGSLEFKRAIREFTYQARDADIAVVYYAGHGIEVGGINYLIPVDAKLATDLDAEDEGVSLDRVIRAIEPAHRLRLVILDACRDNPFNKKMQRTMAMRAVNNGLAKIELTLSDTMIAYAAKAGSTAEDGNGANSPFTSALLKHLTEPGLDVRLAFGRVRDEVWARTGHRQEPFVYASLGGSEVPLVPVARKVEPPPSASSENEMRRAYELTAQVATREAWEAFLKDYKTGLYADLARAQLAKLAAPLPRSDGASQATEADRAWDKVKDSNDRVAIRNFILQFPGSVHAPNAQHRLSILEQAAQEREAAAQAEREAAKAREQEAQRAKAAEIEKQREAARQREEEAQRAKAAELEKQREAARQRDEEAQRAKAAEIEKKRLEREAAKQREEEAQRAKAAEAEKQRLEREAARQRDQEAQRVRAAEIEKQRLEREAATRRDEEERVAKAAEAERLRVERDISKRREEEESRVKAADEARQKLEREAALRLEQTCRRDEETLARLKAAGLKARDDVARLEKDLGCERLRSDVVALRDQLTTEAAKQPPEQEPVASLQPPKEPAASEEETVEEPAGRHRRKNHPVETHHRERVEHKHEAARASRPAVSRPTASPPAVNMARPHIMIGM
jgi:uncharacterized caspase-like protein